MHIPACTHTHTFRHYAQSKLTRIHDMHGSIYRHVEWGSLYKTGHTPTVSDNPTRPLTHGHLSVLPLSGGLLKPLLKSKQFHSNLWPTVFSCRALCSYFYCDSCPVESDRGQKESLRDLYKDMKKCQILASLSPFYSTVHCQMFL